MTNKWVCRLQTLRRGILSTNLTHRTATHYTQKRSTERQIQPELLSCSCRRKVANVIFCQETHVNVWKSGSYILSFFNYLSVSRHLHSYLPHLHPPYHVLWLCFPCCPMLLAFPPVAPQPLPSATKCNGLKRGAQHRFTHLRAWERLAQGPQGQGRTSGCPVGSMVCHGAYKGAGNFCLSDRITLPKSAGSALDSKHLIEASSMLPIWGSTHITQVF